MDRAKISARTKARMQAKTMRTDDSKAIDYGLYDKFVRFMSRTRLQKLKEKVTLFYGRNYPILYQDKYNFT